MSKYRKECWTDADVRCPFYISDERSARSITCEGCMEETKATMSFRTLANRDGHMGRFCVGAYERCPVYRSVYQSKYADGEASDIQSVQKDDTARGLSRRHADKA